MDTTSLPTLLGSYLCLLIVSHFVCDWLFQSHGEALRKSKDWFIRLGHCVLYTALMLGCLWLFWRTLQNFQILLMMTGIWLLVTHFFIDTYLPTYWWMRYVRRPPVVVEKGKEGFKEYAQTPLGIVLVVTVDQIFHVLSLMPVAYLLSVWKNLQPL
jgi:hypothetical protein